MNNLVQDWMTPNPVTTASGASLAEARALMERDDIRRLLVVEDGDTLVGVVSWGDIMEAWPSRFTMLEPAEVREQMARVRIDEVMSTDVVTIDPDASISEAVNVMFEHHVGALPVVEGRRVVGILSNSDILRGLVRILASLEGAPVARG